jgi:alkaline phosphatase D
MWMDRKPEWHPAMRNETRGTRPGIASKYDIAPDVPLDTLSHAIARHRRGGLPLPFPAKPMKTIRETAVARPAKTCAHALVIATIGLVTLMAARGTAATENFDSHANGTVVTTIGGGAVWTIGGYSVIDGGGVAGSKGIGTASPIVNWKGQPFQWAALAVGSTVRIGLDFQSSATGKFDDDRVGWTIDADSSGTTTHLLALQLDNTAEGGMVVYWNTTRTQLNPLTGIKNSTWYRFTVDFTKLTQTSAAITGTLVELDASGNATGTPYVGTVPDTSAFSNPPATARFTSTYQWPSFKNYSSASGNADNAVFSIIPPVPQPPSVAITSPANFASTGPDFTITAEAADEDGTVASVAFHDGETLLGTDTSSPFGFQWTGAPSGPRTLTATATDNDNLTTTSEIVHVYVVTEGGNQAPSAQLTYPADGAVFVAPANISLTASASDEDGSVAKVVFFDGQNLLGESLSAPYSHAWSISTPGTYTLSAVATDNEGAFNSSAPVTITVLPPATVVAGPWSGNITSTSATVKVVISEAGQPVRVLASTSPDLSNPVFSTTAVTQAASGNSVRLDLSGLTPLNTYHYAVELGGIPVTSGDLKGKFTTHPVSGPASFKFSFASCGDYANTSQYAYESIVNENPLFFIHMGDMNYDDINSTDPATYRNTYTNLITQGQLRRVCRAMGMNYIWDDHDYAGNDSNKNNIGRSASRQVYRERFPHYPLPAGGPDAAIYQTYKVGRVQFILSDLRSERDPVSNTDNASKSHMGAVQKQWFKDQLIAARNAETPLVVWLSSVPFISTSTSGDDWGRFQTERREILEFIRDNRIQNICIISGDMHALALDDGTGTHNYVAGVRIPVFHAAALARSGSTKGGPYTVDGATVTPSAGLGRYGNLLVNDNGSSVSATYEGRIATGSGSTLTGVSTWRTYLYQAEPVRPRAALAPSALPALESVRVTWSDDSTVESGYRIERSPAAAATWAAVGLAAANQAEFEDNTVAEGTSYDYRVIAVNTTVEADPSAITTVTSHTALENWKLENTGDAHSPDDGDDDGDGYTHLQEFLLGMNGTTPDRYPFEITRDGESGNYSIVFPTLARRVYRIQYISDLLEWLPASDPVTGDGSIKSWIDDGTQHTPSPSSETARRLYRIKVSFEP